MLKFNGNKTIVTFGELLLRLSAPGYQRLFQTNEFVSSFCGAEANVAVALSNFGESVKFVSSFPNNDVGESALRELQYFGVDVSDILFSGKRMGLYYFENGASQRSSKVIYDREKSAFALSNLKDYNWDEIFSKACWFHFTGINPALSSDVNRICIQACEEAKKRGVIISCDLNYRSALWTKEEAKKHMEQLFKYVDVCIGNEEDAETVFGIKAIDTDVEKGLLNKKGYESVAKQISKKYGCSYVALTLRTSLSATSNKWAGILYDAKCDKSYFSDEYLIHFIVDRVGSGDSFAAGIIYSLLNNYENQKAVDFSVAASCLKHSIEGDFNRISIEEVFKLIKTKGSGRILR